MRLLAHARLLALAVLTFRVSTTLASPPVLINEVFYDATGSDTGLHFIELVNATDSTVALAGYRLEAGDGANPERWRALWFGGASDAVAPHARFTIGETGVSPAANRFAVLELENGPDAVRLVAPDGATDVLGYGELTDLAQFEGRPAPDVIAGLSLARLPDGHDTDDNAADFQPLSPPTPGAANRPERDVAWVWAAPLAERIELGEQATFRGVLVERGSGVLAAGEVAVLLWAAPPRDDGEPPGSERGDSLVVRSPGNTELAPGDSLRFELGFTPDHPGAWRVTLSARTLDDAVPGNDRTTAVIQVGPGPLVLNEIAHAPDDGPEWIELASHGVLPVAIDGWQIEDASGRHGLVRVTGGGAFDVAPESLVVVTSSPSDLRARYPGLDPRSIAACTPWPALNNGSSATVEAERVVLRDPDGRVSDLATIPGGVPAGATRERRSLARPSGEAGNWGWSAVSGGTPARANSLLGLAGPGVELAIAPQRLVRAAGQAAVVRYRTGFERARVRLEVYDVRGRPRRTLVDGDAPGAAGVAFDGADDAGVSLAPGLYVLALDARSEDGTAAARRRTWVTVE